jgi:hypothetical protein
MRSPCCLCIPPYKLLNCEPIFMKLCMYIMAPEPISTAYFINPSSQSVSICASHYRCSVTAQYKRYRGNAYTCNSKRIVGRVLFYAIRVLSRKVGDWVFPELLVVFNIQNSIPATYIYTHVLTGCM